MRKMDAVGHPRGNGGHIIPRMRAKRAGTERHAIGRAVLRRHHPFQIVTRGHDARQAKNVARRIVGMDTKADAKVFGGRDNLSQEPRVVRA